MTTTGKYKFITAAALTLALLLLPLFKGESLPETLVRRGACVLISSLTRAEAALGQLDFTAPGTWRIQELNIAGHDGSRFRITSAELKLSPWGFGLTRLAIDSITVRLAADTAGSAGSSAAGLHPLLPRHNIPFSAEYISVKHLSVTADSLMHFTADNFKAAIKSDFNRIALLSRWHEAAWVMDKGSLPIESLVLQFYKDTRGVEQAAFSTRLAGIGTQGQATLSQNSAEARITLQGRTQLLYDSLRLSRPFLLAAPDSVALEAEMSYPQCRIRAHAELPRGHAALNAHLMLDGSAADSISMQMTDVSLPLLLSALEAETGSANRLSVGHSPLSALHQGNLNLKLNISGPIRQPGLWQGHGLLTADRLAGAEDTPWPDITAMVKAGPGTAALLIEQGANRINAALLRENGNVIGGTASLALNQVSTLSALAGRPDISGQIHGRARLDAVQPVLLAELSAGGALAWKNLHSDTLTATVQIQGSRITLSESRFSLVQDLGRQPSDLTQPLKQGGVLIVFAEARGPLDALQSEINAKWHQPQFENFSADSLSFGLTLVENTFQLTELTLAGQRHQMAGTGHFGLKNRIGQLRLGWLDTPSEPTSGSVLIDLLPASNDRLRVSGRLHQWPLASAAMMGQIPLSGLADGQFNFDPDNRQSHYSLRLEAGQLQWQDVAMDSLHLSLHDANGNLVLNSLSLKQDRHLFSLNGEAGPFDWQHPSLPASISVEALFQDIPLSWAQPLNISLLPDGIVNGHLILTGDSDAPLANGHVELSVPEWQLSPRAIPLKENRWLFSLKDSVLTLDQLQGRIGRRHYAVSGTLTHRSGSLQDIRILMNIDNDEALTLNGAWAPDRLALKAVMDTLDLSLLSTLDPALSTLIGSSSGWMQVQGSSQKPTFTGAFHAGGIHLAPPVPFPALHDGELTFSISETGVRLDSLKLPLGKGLLTAQGEAALPDFSTFPETLQLRLKGSQLEMADKLRGTALIDGLDITIAGRHSEFLCSGQVSIGQSRWQSPLTASDFISMVNRAQRPSQKPPEWMRRLKLNLKIDNSGSLWIDNNLSRSRLSAHLSLSGTAVQPILGGRIKVEEGYVYYLDRRFEISQGTADFTDPYRINPALDIKAAASLSARQVQGQQAYEIFLTLQGNRDNLEFGLHSRPELDRMDIAALLTTGATRSEMTSMAGSEGVSGLLKDRLGDISSRSLSSYATRHVSSLLRLDRVSVEGNLFSSKGKNSPQLLASKQLNNRMSVGYSAALGNPDEQLFSIDYRLAPHISLVGSSNRDGHSGLDFKFWWKWQ